MNQPHELSETEQHFRTLITQYLEGKVSFRNTLARLIPFVFPVSNLPGPIYQGPLIIPVEPEE